MRIFKLLKVLKDINMLSLFGMYRLISAFNNCGINIMTLLHFAGSTYGNRIALVDDNETLTYKELLTHSEKLAIVLKENVQLESGQKIAFLCHNHASLIKSMFAASRVGADLYLLNAEISANQLKSLHKRHQFDVLIHDAELTTIVEEIHVNNTKILSYHEHLPAINNFLHTWHPLKKNLPKAIGNKLVLQTGGTTGISKEPAHKPSFFNYLNPFLALFNKFKMSEHRTAYIATPIYHGYGLGVMLLFFALGKKVVVSYRFNAKEASQLIRKHQVEVVTVVPLMLQKMLYHHEYLVSLKCIASGGAKLSTKLIEETQNKLGDVLYNLYGTSEAGLNMIATPKDLRYSSTTIGKAIKGVQLKVVNQKMEELPAGEIGQLCISNDWSMRNRDNNWIETGDLGFQDEQGYYYLRGRTDDMVVSGGENVYPIELEQVLILHAEIEDVAVIGIPDEQFGQRLKVFVLPIKNATLSQEELTDWLRSRVARFQMPKEIVMVNYLPYTQLGKLDKKQLKLDREVTKDNSRDEIKARLGQNKKTSKFLTEKF
jgi:acyl-CoA synthetase (AMP-forming)/AMP-acid ligase II